MPQTDANYNRNAHEFDGALVDGSNYRVPCFNIARSAASDMEKFNMNGVFQAENYEIEQTFVARPKRDLPLATCNSLRPQDQYPHYKAVDKGIFEEADDDMNRIRK